MLPDFTTITGVSGRQKGRPRLPPGAANYHIGYGSGRRSSSLLQQYFSYVVAPTILAIWLFGGVTQFQVAFFGHVYVYSVHLKIALLTVTLFLWGCTQALAPRPLLEGMGSLRSAYGYWIGYTCLAVLLIWARFSYPADYILFSLNVMFFYPLFMGFLVVRPPSHVYRGGCDDHYRKHGRRMFRLLTIIAVPIIGLGIAQFLLDDPLLPTSIEQQEYLRVIHSTFIGGRTRAFAIFTSGWAFGDYATFMVLLWLSVATGVGMPLWRKLVLIILAVMAGFGVVGTLTRAVYLQCLIALFGLYLLRRRSIGDKIYVACAFGVAALIAAALLTGFERLGSEGGYITNTASIYSRFLHWEGIVSRLNEGSAFVNWAFGKGLIANERYALASGFNTDNVYLAVILYSGVVGLGTVSYLFLRVFQLAVKRARVSGDPYWGALAAFLFAVPSVGVWNVQLNTPALLLVLVWLISPPVTGGVRARRTVVARRGVGSDPARRRAASGVPAAEFGEAKDGDYRY